MAFEPFPVAPRLVAKHRLFELAELLLIGTTAIARQGQALLGGLLM